MIDRIERVGVLGAGLMGHGIAQLAAQAGCQVVLVDISEKELQKGWAKIQKLWNKDVEKGKLTPEQSAELTKLITTSLDMNDLADCDVVIEAIPEIMELKKETFAKLDRIVKPDAILATNTSQLSITEIATATSRADQVIGMHFFYPAQVMKLIEIPVGEHTSQKCVELIVDLSRRMKKETCVCRDTPGFIVNRLLAGLMVEASRVYDERLASVEEIDKAMRFALGHPMGPFQLFDFSGIDTMVRVADGLRAAFGDRFCIGVGTRNKVRAGDFGQKTGRGFYEY
ncbi:MAG: 3-hydroxyacyl-CoA dehydrogenase family protein [Bacillota bacterium]